jgi:hypothetical protein
MTSKNKTKLVVGIFEYLTIIFVVLKLTGLVDFTWWQAFSPAIIAISAGMIEGFIEAVVEHNQKKTRRTDE